MYKKSLSLLYVFKVKQTFKNDKVQISYKKVILKNSKSE